MNVLDTFLNKIDWIYNTAMSKRYRSIKPKFQILNLEDSLKVMRESKCSLARFGDGEFTLMLNGEFLYTRNRSLKFQRSDNKLKARLLEIIRDRNVNDYNLKIGIPESLIEENYVQFTEPAVAFWKHYSKYFICLIL